MPVIQTPPPRRLVRPLVQLRPPDPLIQPPALLVFTWRSEFTGMRDTVVTVQLTERGPRETEIEVTHELTSEDEATSHAGGWGQLLARLEAYLEDR